MSTKFENTGAKCCLGIAGRRETGCAALGQCDTVGVVARISEQPQQVLLLKGLVVVQKKQ